MSLRTPRTRPWLVDTTILREVSPYEDGARPDAGSRLVLLGSRADHIRTSSPGEAVGYVVTTLAAREAPHLAAEDLGLGIGEAIVMVARCGGVEKAFAWAPATGPAEMTMPAFDDDARPLVAARTRLLRLLADHGRRDPRRVQATERARLAAVAAREAASHHDDPAVLAAALVAEQVGDPPPAEAGSAMRRLLGDL
jgi:hypothetical protein